MTNSWCFPNIFDCVRNKVNVISDNPSIVNRSRLLILTSPTELYNEPNFGVGLPKYLWQYNTENQKSIIRDNIAEQLRLHEPCCDPEQTQYADGLLFTGNDDVHPEYNQLKMTVAIKTKLGSDAVLDLSSEQAVQDFYNSLK